ncbi:MAG: pentapeptide repeat-containing protein [Bacteroidota bacterium]
MDFWKIAAIATWAVIAILAGVYIYIRRKPLSTAKSVLLGRQLHSSINQLFDEVAERKVQRQTLADTSKYVLHRFTRIGLFAILAALIPVLFLSIQTYLLSVQNDRIDLQNNLIEAQRRGSLVILMSNIMEQMNDEINEYKKQNPDVANDSIGYPLSQPLIGRIIGLNEGFLPYRIFQDGDLTEEEYSVERGQLLLSLANSKLDSNTINNICNRTTFRQSYLRGVNFSGINLRELQFAPIEQTLTEYDRIYSLGTIWSRNNRSIDLSLSNLNEARFVDANLGGADFSGAKLADSDFSLAQIAYSDLSKADFSGADLSFTDLKGANAFAVNFNNADLGNANLNGVNLYAANLKGAVLEGASLYHVRNLKLNQLLSVRGLFGSVGIDSTLTAKIKEKKPCLFFPGGCNHNQ